MGDLSHPEREGSIPNDGPIEGLPGPSAEVDRRSGDAPDGREHGAICPDCGGAGEDGNSVCPRCQGTGRVR